MFRPIPSLLALMTATMLAGPALAADIDNWDDSGPALRDGYPTEPGDWAGLGDKDDPISMETGVRYWYALGGQSFGSGGSALSSQDASHIGELHLRVEDHSSNVYAKAIAGYSVKMDGTYKGPLTSGDIVDGHVGYVGADIGWNTFTNGSAGVGPFLGYMYWQDEPDTGRNNFTTVSSSSDVDYDPGTGQTFLPGDSAPNHVDTHLLRLGVSGKAVLGDYFDITAEVAAVPYAKVSGSVGVDDPTFSTATYAGPAQLPYASVANGNIHTMRASTTQIDGWGYGAQAEAWVGFHPTEHLAFRLGGRLWYLQGTTDSTYTKATIGDPTDADLDGTYDTKPSVVKQDFISTNQPFKMFRYGILGEMTYAF